jgi:hypothetical protein
MKTKLQVHSYYDVYIPYERLKEDIARMKEAGIKVLRIMNQRGCPLTSYVF